MKSIAIVYWSGTGNTEAMANLVAAGARGAGASAELIKAADFGAAKCDKYDAFALGCPAMGGEELEDGEFRPMFDDCKRALSGKRVALFGSYGWGAGDWMTSWEGECAESGITLAAESVIANEYPDDDSAEKCKTLGSTLAK